LGGETHVSSGYFPLDQSVRATIEPRLFGHDLPVLITLPSTIRSGQVLHLSDMAFSIPFCIICSISQPGYTWKKRRHASRRRMCAACIWFCLIEEYGVLRKAWAFLWCQRAYNTLLVGRASPRSSRAAFLSHFVHVQKLDGFSFTLFAFLDDCS
jgi:hypothetical protein